MSRRPALHHCLVISFLRLGATVVYTNEFYLNRIIIMQFGFAKSKNPLIFKHFNVTLG